VIDRSTLPRSTPLALKAGLSLLTVCLAGCAQYDRYDWTKPGVTNEQLYRDSRECALEASPPRSSGAQTSTMNRDRYAACLTARGYQRNTYVPPPVTDWREMTSE